MMLLSNWSESLHLYKAFLPVTERSLSVLSAIFLGTFYFSVYLCTCLMLHRNCDNEEKIMNHFN